MFDPVNSSISAGAWLNWSVYIDFTNAMSSVCLAMFGSISLSHAPLCPYCLHL